MSHCMFQNKPLHCARDLLTLFTTVIKMEAMQ